MYQSVVRLLLVLAVLVWGATYSIRALAMSTYARQTGLPCAACHFQNYPALNQLGRMFKANGFALSVAPAGSEAAVLSLKDSVNAGVVTKIRYQQSNGNGPAKTNDGEFQFPDELLLHIGARISNNIGAVRFARLAEDRSAVSAQQYVGTATKAQGIAAVASNSGYFANFSKWSPRTTGDASDSLTATYVRLAATPRLGSLDTGFGIQSWSGSAMDPTLMQLVDTDAWAVDAQAQGAFRDMPLGLYLTYAESAATPVGSMKQNLFNANPQDRKATALLAQLGVVPAKIRLLLSYRHGENGKTINANDNAWMIGGTYSLGSNMQLQINHTQYSGSAYRGNPPNGSRMTTLMFYSAF